MTGADASTQFESKKKTSLISSNSNTIMPVINSSYSSPPYSIRVEYTNNTSVEIVVRVTLHRVPPRYINLVVSSKRFYVDTLQYTKKLVLDVPYSDDDDDEIIVDDGAALNATLEYGILTVRLPVISSDREHRGISSVTPQLPQSTTSNYKRKQNTASINSNAMNKQASKRKAKRKKSETSNNSTDESVADINKRFRNDTRKKNVFLEERCAMLALADVASTTEEKRLAQSLATSTARLEKVEKRAVELEMKRKRKREQKEKAFGVVRKRLAVAKADRKAKYRESK